MLRYATKVKSQINAVRTGREKINKPNNKGKKLVPHHATFNAIKRRTIRRSNAPGCVVSFPERASSPISQSTKLFFV